MTITVRPITPRDADACPRIVRELPEFFTRDVPDRVREDIKRHRCWVVGPGTHVYGFAVVEHREALVAKILWTAVAAEHRNAGLGGALVRAVLRALRAEGVHLVQTKTLDRSAGYRPYEATIRFWERHGFVQTDTIDPMPGWEPGKPSAILVAALAPTVALDVTSPA